MVDDNIKKSKQSQTFKDLSILFYTQQIAQIIKSYQRSNFIGIMLLVIYYSQLASMLFEEKVIQNVTISDISQRNSLFQVSQYIRCSRIYTIQEVIAERSENLYSRSNNNESSSNSDEVEIAQSQINFSIFGISYNFFVMAYIMIQYTLWIMSHNYQTSSKNEQSIQEEQINNVVKKKFNLQNYSFMKKFFKPNGPLNKFVSIIFQTYRYTVTIPFSVVSLSMIFNTNSNLNDQLAQEFRILLGVSLFLSTFIINLLIIINDFDYSIRYRDFFGSRVNNFRWVYFSLDLLASYCCTQLENNMNIKLYLWIHILQSLARLTILIYEFPFFFELAQNCHFCGSFSYLLISILEIFSIQVGYKTSFSFLLLSLLPITLKISSMTLKWRESFYTAFISEKNIQNISAFHLEYYMRKVLIPLCQLDIEQYISKKFEGQGIKYETIYTQHIIYCQARGVQDQNRNQDQIKNANDKQQKQNSEEFQCFCQKYQLSELNLNNMNGHQQRKQFIVEYIYYLLNLSFNKNFQGQHNYEQRLTKKNSPQSVLFLKEIKPTYIYYLIQVASTPAKAYTEVFTIKQKYNQMTIQEQYMIELTIQDLNYEFLSFFDHSIYQNQRLKIGDVYQFDHAYRDSFSELSKGLKIKQEFFQFLNQDSIILENLTNKSQKTVIQIQVIEDSLINLLKMNPLHQRTLQLSSIFLDHFDFKKRTLTSLILQATYQNELENPHQIRNELEKSDFKINLFHQKSAAAFFLSLQNKTILRSSDSFSQLFGVNSSDIIGKPISLLFPDYYFPHISSYIERLVEEANIDLIKIGLYYTFIRTAKESLYPVVMRVKLDFLNEQTFGLSCYMQRIENDKFYIICDSNFKFLDASSQLKTLLLKNFQQNKKRKNTSDLLQKVNVRNFIPILYGIEKFQELNQFDEKSKSYQNYERQTNFQQFNSILFLPTNKPQLSMLQKQVKQEIYDVSQYFKEFKPSEFDSVQKFKKIHEINDHLDQIKEKFQKYFSHPVEIQEYENTSKNNSFIKEIQNYTTQETYFKIDNQPSEAKDKEDSQNNTKPEVNTLQEIDYFESNYLHESKKKDQLIENDVINSIEKQSSKYSEKPNELNNEDFQQIQNLYPDQLQQYYENYQAAAYQNEYSLWPISQKDIPYGQENQNQSEHQIMREKGEYINNLQSYNQLGYQNHNNEATQSDLINNSDQKNHQKFQKKLQKLIIKSPRASNINVISIEDEQKYQHFASPKFGQELVSPLSTHKDNEESQRYFVKNSPNKDNFQNSQSASHLINGSLISPTIKVNEMYYESTIDDKQSQKNQIIHPQSFHNSKNNEKLLQLQPISIDQYSVSHTSIEQEIKNNIQIGHKSILSKSQTNRQLSRKEIQTLERNVTKLYNAQNTKNFKYDGEDDERGERRDQYSQFKKISDLGIQESEHSKRQEKTGFQNNAILKKMFDSQLFFKRQFLSDMVTKRQELIQVKYARNVGLFFLVLLVAISTGLYLTLVSYFNNGWDYFKDMLIGYDILESYSQAIRQKELLLTLQMYGIPGYNLHNQTQILLETQERDYRQIQLRQLIDYFIANCVNKGFEKYMLEEEIQVSFLTNQNQPIKHLNFTRIYSLLNIPLYLWDYTLTNNQDSQTYILENYYNIMDMIAYIVNISSTTSYNKIKSSENLLYLSITLIELFSLLLIMLVFPIYYIVQSKREEILKLLATFDSNFLEKIIQKCNLELLENKQNFGSSKTLRSIKTNKNVSSKNILSQTQIGSGQILASSQFKRLNKKRKAVSQTNSLQNLFYNQLFSNEELLSNIQLQYSRERDISVLKQFKEKILDQQLQERITDLYKVDETFQKDRSQMDKYKQDYLMTIKEDACQILIDNYNIQSMDSKANMQNQINETFDPKVDPNKCSSILNGKLKQGLTITLKELINEINQLYLVFTSTNDEQELFLTLIPIENLVENQYVISFINKQIPYQSK
ncbi:transmembrane protein, putative (macronuclear) [Tetrahymena thermophila SB210]|uniref:Transmembrane protein, putative n=1 Tax=Tetrahymena thermophila (strain SB210) TaxID=312017 RepID=I7MG27_TETTS|nr:transmembrane protein, putative [Tetrahymena thermophila SB210]EAS00905.2 transmembrane protein, putative [Tetrahymena thermophila SB210]|eukprot:XP_001021151.2 transmembrane protein, putative [Tetrahymena thermophila SB210]